MGLSPHFFADCWLIRIGLNKRTAKGAIISWICTSRILSYAICNQSHVQSIWTDCSTGSSSLLEIYESHSLSQMLTVNRSLHGAPCCLRDVSLDISLSTAVVSVTEPCGLSQLSRRPEDVPNHRVVDKSVFSRLVQDTRQLLQ